MQVVEEMIVITAQRTGSRVLHQNLEKLHVSMACNECRSNVKEEWEEQEKRIGR